MRAIAKSEKRKAPTLDELVAQERWHRELLESSMLNLADEIYFPGELPAMEGFEEDDIDFLAREIALHGRGIDHDATEWGKAAVALAKAMAKSKKAA